jgi:hypothetical protein
MALITPFLICGANRQKLHFGASGASRKRTRFLWQQEISYYWTADGMLPILASCESHPVMHNAAIRCGRGIRDQVREAIQLLSGEPPVERVFTHTPPFCVNS